MRFTLSASPRGTLVALLWMRILEVAGQAAVVAVAWYGLHVILPIGSIALVIAVLAVSAFLTALRLCTTWPCTDLELTFQLLLDTAALTAILYFSGGTTNPFASLFLVPVAIAAVALRWWYTAAIVAACLGCYAFLMHHFVPLAYADGDVEAMFNLHIVGMGVNFAASALLLAVFLALMTRELQRRERELAELREASLQRQHLASMGLLAAGAAHELGTPLSTMMLLVTELKELPKDSPLVRASLDLLGLQVKNCKDKLNRLLQLSGHGRAPETRIVGFTTFLHEAMDAVAILHPRTRFELRPTQHGMNPMTRVDVGLVQTVNNLLNNAAEAGGPSGGAVVVSVLYDEHAVHILIDDDGPGLDSKVQRLAGRAVITTKPGGMGLGLMLSNVNLNRLGGEVSLSRREQGGTRTSVRLPLDRLKVEQGA
jgi:two-component system sensor histidine kinase RegB